MVTYELYELDERSGQWTATNSGTQTEMLTALYDNLEGPNRFLFIAPFGQPPASRPVV